MRRLTLILSDLYLPEETHRGIAVPSTRDLPNLEWLLRFADSPDFLSPWETLNPSENLIGRGEGPPLFSPKGEGQKRK